MPRGVHKADKDQKKNAYITFYPRTAKTEELFFVFFLVSDFSSGNISLSMNSDMGSIQLGPSLIWWIQGTSLCNGVGVHKSSISITRGKSCAEDVAKVTKESVYT